MITLQPTAGFSQVNGKSYRGRIQVDSRGNLINEVIVDDWLKGLLDAEIGSDSPYEALKAQAVAARSEAISGLLSPPHKSSGYDFCTSVHCQAYKGASTETDETRRACDDTFGEVLISAGDVIDAVYHNVCGGVTANAEDVWNSDPEPGCRGKFDTPRSGFPSLQNEAAFAAFIDAPGTDAFCYPGNPGYASYAKKYFRWQKTFSGDELGRICGVGAVRDIRVSERKQSGRVRKLEIVGANGRSKTIEKEFPIRDLLDLWSGLFYLKVQKSGAGVSQVTFVGAGNGHGVGLCQHGAREIARRGGTYSQILGHYYSDVTLKKLYRP
jgi:peptidoglycan hydrolase-like amidase